MKSCKILIAVVATSVVLNATAVNYFRSALQLHFARRVFHLNLTSNYSTTPIPFSVSNVLFGNHVFSLSLDGQSSFEAELTRLTKGSCFGTWKHYGGDGSSSTFQMGAFVKQRGGNDLVSIASCKKNGSLSLYLYADQHKRKIDGVYFVH